MKFQQPPGDEVVSTRTTSLSLKNGKAAALLRCYYEHSMKDKCKTEKQWHKER